MSRYLGLNREYQLKYLLPNPRRVKFYLRLNKVNRILTRRPYGAKSAGIFAYLDSLRHSICIDLWRGKVFMSKFRLVVSH